MDEAKSLKFTKAIKKIMDKYNVSLESDAGYDGEDRYVGETWYFESRDGNIRVPLTDLEDYI